MLTRMTRTLTLLAAAAMTTAGLSACSSGAKAYRDPFEVGSDRAPTPRTLLMMARLMTEKGDHVQAEYILARIAEETPSYTPAWVELSELQLRQGRRFEARQTLEAAAEFGPPDAVLANNLGLLLLAEQDHAGAGDAFQQAVNTDPTEARYHANLATALALQGRDEEAIAHFTKAVPEAQAYWNLGVLSEAVGNPRLAADAYARADELDPGLGAAADVERLAGLAFVVVPPSE